MLPWRSVLNTLGVSVMLGQLDLLQNSIQDARVLVSIYLYPLEIRFVN